MRKISLFLLALAAALPAAGQSHPFTARDLHLMQRLSDPQPSPDGRRVAFVVRTTDFEANRGRNDIWVSNLDGSGLTQVTTHEGSDTNPRWSPDGKSLYFLSTRSGSSQVPPPTLPFFAKRDANCAGFPQPAVAIFRNSLRSWLFIPISFVRTCSSWRGAIYSQQLSECR